MSDSIFSKQFMLFLLTIGFAALVNFSRRLTNNLVFSYSVSIILEFIAVIVVSYILFGTYKFNKAAYNSTEVNFFGVTKIFIMKLRLFKTVFPMVTKDFNIKKIAQCVSIEVPIVISSIGHSIEFKQPRQHPCLNQNN